MSESSGKDIPRVTQLLLSAIGLLKLVGTFFMYQPGWTVCHLPAPRMESRPVEQKSGILPTTHYDTLTLAVIINAVINAKARQSI